MTFRDTNAFCAYCYLLSRCWDDVRDLIPHDRTQSKVSDLLGRLIPMIVREASACSVREAREWLSVLRLEPWASHLGPRWGDVLRPFSARVDCSLGGAQVQYVDAADWILFLRENAREETHEWLAERLSMDRLGKLPTRLAEEAFQVLEATATASAIGEAKTLQGLAALTRNDGADLWVLKEFREALWMCLRSRPDRHGRVWLCLERVLEETLDDLDRFTQWVDTWLELEKLGL